MMQLSLKIRAAVSRDDGRADALRRMRSEAHVRGCLENYAGLPASPRRFCDYVVPVERLLGGVETAHTLFTDALSQGVVIASPSTLLALLRTVDHVWRIENQNKNTRQIAELGGKLYDQFALSAESFEDVGERIRKSQEAFDKATNRLSTGRGNVLRRAEQLKTLGVASTRQLPDSLQDLDD
jgi:Uncharacterized protein conserved in bacteria